MKLHEIPDHKASNLGVFLPNILEMEEDELIEYVVLTSDFGGHMVFVFDNGKIAKVPLKSYETKTNRKKLVKAYSDYGALIRMHFITEDQDFVLVRYNSPEEYRLVQVSTELVPEKATKNTRGVQVVRMKKGSAISGCYMPEELEIEDLSRFAIKKVPMSGKEVDMIERTYLMGLEK
jgi:DNA gyrase subunit A